MVPVGAGHGSGRALEDVVTEDVDEVPVMVDEPLVTTVLEPDLVEVVLTDVEVDDEVESFFAPIYSARGTNLTLEP